MATSLFGFGGQKPAGRNSTAVKNQRALGIGGAPGPTGAGSAPPRGRTATSGRGQKAVAPSLSDFVRQQHPFRPPIAGPPKPAPAPMPAPGAPASRQQAMAKPAQMAFAQPQGLSQPQASAIQALQGMGGQGAAMNVPVGFQPQLQFQQAPVDQWGSASLGMSADTNAPGDMYESAASLGLTITNSEDGYAMDENGDVWQYANGVWTNTSSGEEKSAPGDTPEPVPAPEPESVVEPKPTGQPEIVDYPGGKKIGVDYDGDGWADAEVTVSIGKDAQGNEWWYDPKTDTWNPAESSEAYSALGGQSQDAEMTEAKTKIDEALASGQEPPDIYSVIDEKSYNDAMSNIDAAAQAQKEAAQTQASYAAAASGLSGAGGTASAASAYLDRMMALDVAQQKTQLTMDLTSQALQKQMALIQDTLTVYGNILSDEQKASLQQSFTDKQLQLAGIDQKSNTMAHGFQTIQTLLDSGSISDDEAKDMIFALLKASPESDDELNAVFEPWA